MNIRQHPHTHPHSHEHAHPHEHAPRPEAHNVHAGNGPVMLDIGQGAGALILYADPQLVGAEIEISPVGRDERRNHVAVLARPSGGRTICAAVYPGLAAGSWQLWDPESGRPVLTVAVTDGDVTEAHWPGRS
jgi:hypothetical protein